MISGAIARPLVVRETGPADSPKPRLLDRVRAALRARHYSRRTEEAYVAWIRRYIFFHRDLRLRALADSPDAFGSTLAQEGVRPDTDWAHRLASSADARVNLPLVAEMRGELVGLAWGRIDMSDPDVAALYQMWVAPTYRGRGVGRKLLE